MRSQLGLSKCNAWVVACLFTAIKTYAFPTTTVLHTCMWRLVWGLLASILRTLWCPFAAAIMRGDAPFLFIELSLAPRSISSFAASSSSLRDKPQQIKITLLCPPQWGSSAPLNEVPLPPQSGFSVRLKSKIRSLSPPLAPSSSCSLLFHPFSLHTLTRSPLRGITLKALHLYMYSKQKSLTSMHKHEEVYLHLHPV